MGKKYKVAGKVTIYVNTWIEDDGKIDLKDQAYDQIRDLVSSVEHTCPGSGDEVDISEIEVESVTEDKEATSNAIGYPQIPGYA